jgi:hypothetical protein
MTPPNQRADGSLLKVDAELMCEWIGFAALRAEGVSRAEFTQWMLRVSLFATESNSKDSGGCPERFLNLAETRAILTNVSH